MAVNTYAENIYDPLVQQRKTQKVVQNSALYAVEKHQSS